MSEPQKSAVRVELYTIGHSNHTLSKFLELLRQHHIETLADIRRFPGSRTHPHFGKDALSEALAAEEIQYHWLEELGGRRAKGRGEDSPNRGWRNTSFRNYADYMSTPEFASGIDRLRSLALERRTAIMCSESVFWRCHRRLVSDYVTAHGWSVQHIFPSGDPRPHTLTAGAVVAREGVIYPPTS